MRLKPIYLPSLVLISLAAAFFLWPKGEALKVDSKESKWGVLPPPTEIAETKKKRKEFKRKRLEWEEESNTAATGVDWRKMNDEARLEIRKNRGVGKSGLAVRTRGQESFADGTLFGEWSERGAQNVAGRMRATDIDFDAGKIYSGSDGGVIWQAPLAGNDWTPLNDYATNDIRFVRVTDAPTSGKRILMGGNKSFFYSDDEGSSWTESMGFDSLKLWGSIERVVMTNQSTPEIYVLVLEWDYTAWVSQSKIYKSNDLGVSFSKVVSLPDGPNNKDLWSSRYGTDSAVYLAIDRDVYELGTSLGYLGTVPGSLSGRTRLTGSEATGSTVLHLMVDTMIYRGTSGGTFWTLRGAIPAGIFARSFNASVKTPNVLFYGGVNCFRSTNAGSSWNLVNQWWEYYGSELDMLHADIFGIDVILDPSGNEWVYINCDGGLYRSNNRLIDNTNITMNGIGTSQYYGTYSQRSGGSGIFAGSQDQGFQRCLDDSGDVLGFEQTISGDYGNIVSQNGGTSLFSVYPGFVLYYADILTSTASQGWDFSSSSWLNGWQWMTGTAAHPSSADKCYVGGGDSLLSGQYIWLIESIAGDLEGTRLSYDFSLSGTNEIKALAISPVDDDYRYVLTNKGRFFHSSNGGASWTLSAFNDANFNGTKILPSPTTLGLVYISGSGYSTTGVWRSINHGVGFGPLNTDIPSTNFNDIALNGDEDLIFAATPIGPHVYSLTLSKWFYLGGTVAPEQDFRSVDYVPALDIARFGTYGRGIWDFDVQCEIPQNLTVLGTSASSSELIWDAVAGASGYELRYREVGLSLWTTVPVADTFYTVTGLDGGKSYEFEVTVNGCDDYSDAETTDTWLTGIRNIGSEDWRIFPNPSDGHISIECSEKASYKLSILSLNGSLLRVIEFEGSLKALQVNELPKGTYIFRLESEDLRSSKIIQIQ